MFLKKEEGLLGLIVLGIHWSGIKCHLVDGCEQIEDQIMSQEAERNTACVLYVYPGLYKATSI